MKEEAKKEEEDEEDVKPTVRKEVATTKQNAKSAKGALFLV